MVGQLSWLHLKVITGEVESKRGRDDWLGGEEDEVPDKHDWSFEHI